MAGGSADAVTKEMEALLVGQNPVSVMLHKFHELCL